MAEINISMPSTSSFKGAFHVLHEIKEGTVFIGNANKVKMHCEAIQGGRADDVKMAVLVDLATGKRHTYGLEALKRCDITILEE